MPEIVIREKARRDVEEQAAFLANESVDLAARFINEFDRAVRRLLRFPRIGRVWPTRNAKLRGLRRLSTPRFPLSVFYRSGDATLEIIRVLHHSRDLPTRPPGYITGSLELVACPILVLELDPD